MSSFQSYLLLSFVTLIGPAVGASCQPHAISLPYKNVRLATTAEARGVLWRIGGPNAQSIALQPSAYYNDTYLWSGPEIDRRGAWCPGIMSSATCTTYRGGLFDRSISTTDSNVATLTPHSFDGTVANWTRDDVKLQDNTTLSAYEFALNIGSFNNFVHKGELGLGRESTFLKTLSTLSKISSKSYSFFWGNEVTSEPREGSLTLGGYDQALVDGANVTTAMEKNEEKCKEGLIVSITSLSLQIEGSAKNAWEGLEELKVCIISSTNNIMSIPESYWAPIEAMLGFKRVSTRNGTSDAYFYNTTLIDPSSVNYSGNMEVRINNQLTVTIPNNQLFFDERYIDTAGMVVSRSTAKQIPIVRIPVGNGMMPRIGGMFFSSAYLVVNHDKSEFSISQAQAKSASQKIMAIDTTNNCVAAVEVASASGTPGSNNNNNGSGGSGGGSNTGSNGSSNNNSSGNSSRRGPSGAVIGGIVVGVIGGLALIAGIAFMLWRRKRQQGSPPISEMEAFHDAPATDKYAYHVAEVHGDGGHEMSVPRENRQQTYELDSDWRTNEAPEHGTVSMIK